MWPGRISWAFFCRWQLVHSFICGALSSAFSTGPFGCGLWHSVQAILRLSWLEPIQCFWLPLLWQSMQTADESVGAQGLEDRIFVLSPRVLGVRLARAMAALAALRARSCAASP